MATEFSARFETAGGEIVGADPAWKPQRQFLWDVVHDTRGLLRDEDLHNELQALRTIDAQPDEKRSEFVQEATKLRSVVEKVWTRAQAQKENQPRFRLITPAGKNEWAVVNFFQEAGLEYALVGGWTGPLLRILGPEPDQHAVAEKEEISVGSKRFKMTAIPYTEYFRNDFETLLNALKFAESKGLRVRLVQR
jgi:hypothetical protein